MIDPLIGFITGILFLGMLIGITLWEIHKLDLEHTEKVKRIEDGLKKWIEDNITKNGN